MDYSNVFVCLMGMGTVFFGLTCLIVLTSLMGRVCSRLHPASAAGAEKSPELPAAPAAENREELAAAISAALAEELGTDITGLRILSMRKV